MSDNLPRIGERLLQTGLLQFGHFEKNKSITNWQFQSALLPSYPDVLMDIGKIGQQHIEAQSVDRLLCLRESLPLAQAISLAVQMPLVYEGGNTGNPVTDLVGAYDVGHPTCLIVHHADELDSRPSLMQDAKHVGLEITHIMALYGPQPVLERDLRFVRLLDLAVIIKALDA